MLKLENIHKSYNGNDYAVKNFNLLIEENEFIVFVGPSGCGKSTTLRMIAGLEDITKGSIEIDQKKVNNVHPKDRDIAMVFQNYALYPHMTVYNNMAFGLKMRKMKKNKIQKKVHESANILEIEHLLERKPKELSGGQKQRVALGRAIVRDAKVYLMDEPLSNLDAKLRIQMRSEIIKLHRKMKATTVYVTHDQTEAMTMADRIVVMKDGIIQQIGTPEEIYKEPANLFVATFMGSPPMNQISTSKDIIMQLMESNDTPSETLKNDVVVGFRPEDIIIDEHLHDSIQFKDLPIELIEMVGSEKLVHLKYMTHNIIVKVSNENNINYNEKLTFFVPFSKIKFFDCNSGRRIN